MAIAALALMCIVFVEVFVRLGTLESATAIGTTAAEAASVLGSKQASDAQKEAAARQSSFAIARHTGLLGAKLALTALAVAAIYYAAKLVSETKAAELIERASSPVGIIAMSAFALLYARFFHARGRRLRSA